MDFWTALTESDENITLFNNANLQAIITFQWGIFLPFYKNMIFYPFLFGCYFPFIFLAMDHDVDEAGTPILGKMSWLSMVFLGAYMVYALGLEMADAVK